MSAIDRAIADIERGELWRARQRLGSYLAGTGYNADVLSFLGDVCLKMHDDYAAGRTWLLSGANGEHVDEAIEVFVRHHGHDPAGVVGALPNRWRLLTIDAYPVAVQRRLEVLGLAEHIARRPPKPRPARKLRDAAIVFALMGFGLLGVFALVLGFRQMLGWLEQLIGRWF